MARVFNTSGPCCPAKHYMLPAEERLSEARRLIDLERYFVLHAPRQTGKTTTVAALAESLSTEGRYTALLASCEEAQAVGEDINRGIAALLKAQGPAEAEGAVAGARVVGERQLRPEARAPGAGGDRHRHRAGAGDRVGGELLVDAADRPSALGQPPRGEEGLELSGADTRRPDAGLRSRRSPRKEPRSPRPRSRSWRGRECRRIRPSSTGGRGPFPATKPGRPPALV